MYSIEYLKNNVWLPYQKAKTIHEARRKAANAFLKTNHECIRIAEDSR